MKSRGMLLDFGGVITRTLFETHPVTERALGLLPGTLSWRGPFHPPGDPLWRSMRDGRISERDYWTARTREVGRLIGEDWEHMETFVRRARGAEPETVIRPEADLAIRQAKAAGAKLAILSNELDLFYGAEFRKRLPLLKLFDVIVDATYTGILKPDPRAYRLCLDRLGLCAADCVFVDDQKRNIDGADAVGLPAVHFDVTRPAASFALALQILGLSFIAVQETNHA
jgi:putative hydrolase of the HAD superfamily